MGTGCCPRGWLRRTRHHGGVCQQHGAGLGSSHPLCLHAHSFSPSPQVPFSSPAGGASRAPRPRAVLRAWSSEPVGGRGPSSLPSSRDDIQAPVEKPAVWRPLCLLCGGEETRGPPLLPGLFLAPHGGRRPPGDSLGLQLQLSCPRLLGRSPLSSPRLVRAALCTHLLCLVLSPRSLHRFRAF